MKVSTCINCSAGLSPEEDRYCDACVIAAMAAMAKEERTHLCSDNLMHDPEWCKRVHKGDDWSCTCGAVDDRITELETVIKDLLLWKSRPWVPSGVNLVGLGSVDEKAIDNARAETEIVWTTAKRAVRGYAFQAKQQE